MMQKILSVHMSGKLGNKRFKKRKLEDTFEELPFYDPGMYWNEVHFHTLLVFLITKNIAFQYTRNIFSPTTRPIIVKFSHNIHSM